MDPFKIEPGDAILYMKVGTHARESLEDIIERKQREIDAEGFAMWGYGGGTCHPRTMVQPFAKRSVAGGQTVMLCMQPMESKHFAEPKRADEFSVDGFEWHEVPPGIHVLGSRFALCIKELRRVESTLALSSTAVALGNSRGRAGNDYIRGRVDKACLEVTDAPPEDEIEIGLVAEVIDPFAVFLRNRV